MTPTTWWIVGAPADPSRGTSTGPLRAGDPDRTVCGLPTVQHPCKAVRWSEPPEGPQEHRRQPSSRIVRIIRDTSCARVLLCIRVQAYCTNTRVYAYAYSPRGMGGPRSRTGPGARLPPWPRGGGGGAGAGVASAAVRTDAEQVLVSRVFCGPPTITGRPPWQPMANVWPTGSNAKGVAKHRKGEGDRNPPLCHGAPSVAGGAPPKLGGFRESMDRAVDPLEWHLSRQAPNNFLADAPPRPAVPRQPPPQRTPTASHTQPALVAHPPPPRTEPRTMPRHCSSTPFSPAPP